VLNKIIKRTRKALRKKFAAPGMMHIARLDPRFSLGECDQYGHRDILWRKKVVAKALSPAELKGSHQGKIYILANGPSLADFDLMQLGIHKSMGMNGSIVKYRDSSILPDFYVILDHTFVRKRFFLIREIVESGVKCFFTYRAMCEIVVQDNTLLNKGNIFLIPGVNDNFDEPVITNELLVEQLKKEKDYFLSDKIINRLVGFSFDICKGVFPGRTVAFQCVQVAAYLGFKQIYLAGMDLGASKTGRYRFYEDIIKEKSLKSNLEKNYDIIRTAFECAVPACETKGIELYNLSAQSRLPESVMKKITFSESLR